MTVFIGLKYDAIGLHLMQSLFVDAIRFKLIALLQFSYIMAIAKKYFLKELGYRAFEPDGPPFSDVT
jgi:hypothetical protein